MKRIEVAAYGGPERLVLVEAEPPAPGPGQIALRVEAASVNFADIQARRGLHHTLQAPPYVPGLDAAGVVTAVGPGVARLRVGQRVMAFCDGGSYTEVALAREALAYPIPDAFDDAAAASAVTTFTAFCLLRWAARLEAGESVLVHAAAGGVGTAALQLAKRFGAGRVIGVVGNAAKRARALEAGADDVLVRGDDALAKVTELTAGAGVDVVLDSIGGPVAEESVGLLARFGRLVHFGQASGQEARVVINHLQVPSQAIVGFSLSGVRRHTPTRLAPVAEEIKALVGEGALRVFVDRRHPLAEAAEAHRRLESGASAGKVLLTT